MTIPLQSNPEMQIYRKEYRGKLKLFSDGKLNQELSNLIKNRELKLTELVKSEKKMKSINDRDSYKQFWIIWGKLTLIINYIDEILLEIDCRNTN